MTIGIKYIAYGNSSGYGLSAVAYVRALHNAGVRVWWQPWFLGPQAFAWRPETGLASLPLAQAAQRDEMSDLPALIAATTQPIDYDTIVVHTVPEHWPRFVEPGKRFVGYTVWEADALPTHWPQLLEVADRILVPSQFNAATFRRAGVEPPIGVVPHIRRHAWSESAPEDGAALRRRTGIPDDHFVLYTIGVWDPRKALGELIDVFAREFGDEDRVTLLVKTSAVVNNAAADALSGTTIEERVVRIVAEANRATGRIAANVVCIAADDISGRTLDAMHATGDAYVSLTHGEGWAMGAFDAATLGRPVIITGWGGPLDYLGDDYPGLVRYELAPVDGWLPHASYRPSQRWAIADRRQAGQLMRAAIAGDDALLAAAASRREAIANRFAEPIVARQFIAALDA